MRVKLIPMLREIREAVVVTVASVNFLAASMACERFAPVAETTIIGMIGRTHNEVVSLIMWFRVYIL